MLKIILVDDDRAELDCTRQLVANYFSGRMIQDVKIECFVSPTEFLRAFRDGNNADIYIFDIVMPELDGISLGMSVRESNKRAAIVYLTSSREYGVASYDVQALDYIVKPCTAEKLSRALDRANVSHGDDKTLRFLVKLSDGIYSLPQSQIVCVEYYSHRLTVHVAGGKVIESVTYREPFMTLVEPLLAQKNFIRISASFVINMMYVEKLRGSEFEMVDGKKLTISRLYLGSRSAYLDFVLDNNA